MSEATSHTGKRCRCEQCQKLDEAFGLNDAEALFDDEMEARRLGGAKSCPCESECKDAEAAGAEALDWDVLDAEDDTEAADEDGDEAEEERAELEDMEEDDDGELAAMLAAMESDDVDFEADLSDEFFAEIPPPRAAMIASAVLETLSPPLRVIRKFQPPAPREASSVFVADRDGPACSARAAIIASV